MRTLLMCLWRWLWCRLHLTLLCFFCGGGSCFVNDSVWASLAGEFEDSEGNGISTRAQLSLLWSYRGKVDWKTFELPFTGIEPAVFLMSGVLKGIDLTDNPLKKCSLWSGAGSPGMRSYWVDVNVARFICGALSSRSENQMSMLVKLEATLFQQIQLNNVFAQVLTGLLPVV